MKMPIEATGGLVVQTDTFDNPVFKESMKRLFADVNDRQRLALSSNATFEVNTHPMFSPFAQPYWHLLCQSHSGREKGPQFVPGIHAHLVKLAASRPCSIWHGRIFTAFTLLTAFQSCVIIGRDLPTLEIEKERNHV